MPILGILASSAPAAAATAFESIATATGTGSSSTITFSSIPSGYQHLQIRYISKTTSTGSLIVHTMELQFNGDTATNYASHSLYGDGGTSAAVGTANRTSIDLDNAQPNSGTGSTSMFGVGIIDIHDYASTSKNKTVRAFKGYELNRTTSPLSRVYLNSGLWMSTSAITSISILNGSGVNWTTTSQFALYGIKG